MNDLKLSFLYKQKNQYKGLYLALIFIFALMLRVAGQPSFKEQQLEYSRVKSAYETNYEDLKQDLEETGVNLSTFELLIIGYKIEKDLQVWLRNNEDASFSLFRTYKFCMLSGHPGPKRQQGDLQVPEGFYRIEIFNPWSKFFLSLGINYPNASDRIRGLSGHLGGDIYIHGSCVTIGCIPITDRYIKELYILCVEAKNNGQSSIPVYLFPAKLENGVIHNLVEKYKPSMDTKILWDELQNAYDIFKAEKRFLKITNIPDGSQSIR